MYLSAGRCKYNVSITLFAVNVKVSFKNSGIREHNKKFQRGPWLTNG